MSYGGLPRDYEMPTKDPDKEDETTAEEKEYTYKDLKEAFEEGYTEELVKHYFESYPEYKKLVDQVNTNVGKFGKAVIRVPEARCNHKWVAYTGLVEQFEYCEHCDEKRK